MLKSGITRGSNGSSRDVEWLPLTGASSDGGECDPEPRRLKRKTLDADSRGKMRAFGILVGLIAAILVWAGISGLWRTSEMSASLAMLSPTDGQAVDAGDWAFRGRISATLMLTLGAVALVVGVPSRTANVWTCASMARSQAANWA